MNNPFYPRLIGKLLGDGCFTLQKGRQPRFQFMHKIQDLSWSTYSYEKLKSYMPLNPPVYKYAPDPRSKAGFTECYVVQSRTSSVITAMESLWYLNRKKKLPFSFITQYFNEESLAWWYQDDGHLSIKSGVPKKIILSTDSFTHNELIFLQEMLKQKFALDFKIDGQRRLILYDQPQIRYFLLLVQPYMQPCMARKQFPIEEKQFSSVSRRTTIYLPSSIVLTKPTLQINDHLHQMLPIIVKMMKNRHQFLDMFVKFQVLLDIPKPFKSYQITLSAENSTLLNEAQYRSGWNNSQTTLHCFLHKNTGNTEMIFSE